MSLRKDLAKALKNKDRIKEMVREHGRYEVVAALQELNKEVVESVVEVAVETTQEQERYRALNNELLKRS